MQSRLISVKGLDRELNASVELGTTPYSTSSGATISTQTITPTVVPTVQTATTTDSVTNKYTALVEKAVSALKLNADQKASALAITLALSAARTELNNKLAAYLIATAFVDANLVPAVEKASTDAKVQAVQAKYTTIGFQGRGFVHFTGAYNYNRYTPGCGLAHSTLARAG